MGSGQLADCNDNAKEGPEVHFAKRATQRVHVSRPRANGAASSASESPPRAAEGAEIAVARAPRRARIRVSSGSPA